MKSVLVFSVICASLMAVFSVSESFSGYNSIISIPDGALEKEANKLDKERWIENMHRAEPGLNWRAVDYETR